VGSDFTLEKLQESGFPAARYTGEEHKLPGGERKAEIRKGGDLPGVSKGESFYP
jgi:hypothetical protein